MVCGVKEVSVYGPVPIGLSTASVSGLAIFDHWCLGTMTWSRMLFWLTYWEIGNVIVTWSPAALTSPIWMPCALNAAWSLSSWNVYALSSAVNGWPSDHFTPPRAVSVSLV